MGGAAESDASVTVPESVLEGIEYVRDSKETNMAKYNTVMRIAHDNDFHATVVWMNDHRERYFQGFECGFTAESNDE